LQQNPNAMQKQMIVAAKPRTGLTWLRKNLEPEGGGECLVCEATVISRFIEVETTCRQTICVCHHCLSLKPNQIDQVLQLQIVRIERHADFLRGLIGRLDPHKIKHLPPF